LAGHLSTGGHQPTNASNLLFKLVLDGPLWGLSLSLLLYPLASVQLGERHVGRDLGVHAIHILHDGLQWNVLETLLGLDQIHAHISYQS
jgi:hypothetical protein